MAESEMNVIVSAEKIIASEMEIDLVSDGKMTPLESWVQRHTVVTAKSVLNLNSCSSQTLHI